MWVRECQKVIKLHKKFPKYLCNFYLAISYHWDYNYIIKYEREVIKMTRADVVRAMEIMVSTINDETIIESWLMVGVADGDITSETTNEEIDELGYTDDTTFMELMTLFLKLMNRAGNDGLYFDRIVSGSKSITWSEGRKC